jgi:murein DD-endopeptidase MepM/ murein hydrolase activator NlpD
MKVVVNRRLVRSVFYVGAVILLLLLPVAVLHSGTGTSHPHPAPSPADAIATNLSDYLWPTDAGHIITSVFSEFRSMHFHGGIDISTGDVTGYKVFASRDGYISRLRIFANGYGKMVFVKHADGYTTTYAHLSRFNTRLDSIARAEQLRTTRYQMDMQLPEGAIPVKQGEVIAYTGDTGIGTPHLHFEIRDPRLEPINPQLAPGIIQPDNVPPEIKRIGLTTIGDGSVVNGEPGTHTFSVRRIADRKFILKDHLTIDGTAGFMIETRDQTEHTHFKRGVYQYHVLIDGIERSSVTMNRTLIEQGHAVGLYFDWDLYDARRWRMERLYQEIPGVLPFYQPSTPRSGLIGTGILQPGPHTFTIVADDAYGNSSEVSGTLTVASPPRFTLSRNGNRVMVLLADTSAFSRLLVTPSPDGSHWLSPIEHDRKTGSGREIAFDWPAPGGVVKIETVDAWGNHSNPEILVAKPGSTAPPIHLTHMMLEDRIEFTVTASGLLEQSPTLYAYDGAARHEISLHRNGLHGWNGSFTPSSTRGGVWRFSASAEGGGTSSSSFEEITLYPILPGRTGVHSIDGGALTVAFDSLSVYRPLLLHVEKEDEGSSPAYRLLPESTVLHEGLRVRLRTGSTNPRLGLYFRGRTGGVLIGRNTGNGVLEGGIHRTLGVVRQGVDVEPPAISKLIIKPLKSGETGVSFKIRDDRSGVEYDSLKVYIDKMFVVPEIDGEHHRVSCSSGAPLKRGTHSLTITSCDRIGNPGLVERTFTVR